LGDAAVVSLKVADVQQHRVNAMTRINKIIHDFLL